MGQWSSLTWGARSFDCTPLFFDGFGGQLLCMEVGYSVWRWVIRWGGTG